MWTKNVNDKNKTSLAGLIVVDVVEVVGTKGFADDVFTAIESAHFLPNDERRIPLVFGIWREHEERRISPDIVPFAVAPEK